VKLEALAARPLRIVFFGTPDLAAEVLRHLLQGEDEVVGVVTRPDARKGRGMETSAPPVKQVAEEHGIEILQPTKWRDGEAVSWLRGLKPDLGVTAAYGRILPQEALDAPQLGCVNVHASLLPRWRGADPIRQAILAGDAETGITIMRMVLEMDAGASLWQRRVPIADDETLASLETKLAQLGGEALLEALSLWRAGRLESQEQDPAGVTLAPLCQKRDGHIDWSQDASALERRIRAFSPWPGASTAWQDIRVRLWTATAETSPPGADTVAPGTVVETGKQGVVVAAREGRLRLLELQPAGKKRMSAADWARGARIEPGVCFGESKAP